ncbi:nuclear pore complex component-domain-containing protein [Bombardia bombarda]|uniref:Nuclear pore complex component-domain-containing protein n=1 Tax=Bombardia bombarda TaxID=252184 RepID=A0AA39XK83_9PEZI|nr:nuclear pore complex component-domain-containing protein [Bombardia bombarda]
MSSSALTAVSTPVKQTQAAPPVTDSPGNWRHPRLAEITRRQSRTVFSEKNARQIAYNVAAIAIFEALRATIIPYWPSILLIPELKQYSGTIYLAILLIPLINIGLALLPLFRKGDDLSDIPLTPSQRKLLGLPPVSMSAPTPGSVYSTPPRYSRTPSLRGSPASIRSHMSSPLSGRGSPAPAASDRKQGNNSPYSSLYSPSNGASPSLLQRAVGGNARRSSFGAASPNGLGASLGASTSSSMFGSSTGSMFGDGPATPTPASGKRSSVSLNNKWLFEKGRRTSGTAWLQ